MTRTHIVLTTLAALIVLPLLAFVATLTVHAQQSAQHADASLGGCVQMNRHHDPVFGDTDTCTMRATHHGAGLSPQAMPWTSNTDSRITIGHAH